MTTTVASYPTTKSGQRNWSWHAVHGDKPVPSKDTLPEVQGGLSTLVDLINPLQHIPGVSNAYRAATGDKISPSANVLGGLLFGGPVGFMLGVGTTIFVEATENAPENAAVSAYQGAEAYEIASRLE